MLTFAQERIQLPAAFWVVETAMYQRCTVEPSGTASAVAIQQTQRDRHHSTAVATSCPCTDEDVEGSSTAPDWLIDSAARQMSDIPSGIGRDVFVRRLNANLEGWPARPRPWKIGKAVANARVLPRPTSPWGAKTRSVACLRAGA